jgi:hypothetical protein
VAPSALFNGYRWNAPMSQHFHFDPSRSLAALDQDSTIIAAIEMSQSKWLAAAVVPGVERQPLKRLDADKEALPKALHRWRNEAGRAGHTLYASSCLTASSVLNVRVKESCISCGPRL